VKYALHTLAALALVSLVSGSSSASPPTANAKVFEAVDAVTVLSDNLLRVEGLLQGESTPQTLSFTINSSSTAMATSNCHRQAMLAISKPGRFFLEFEPLSFSTFQCTLRRR
jgi:hypothetical protein